MTDSEILALLKLTGHLDCPFGSHQDIPEGTFDVSHAAVTNAIASYQQFNVQALDPLCLKHHSRPARCDGGIAEATRELFKGRICGCPDYGAKVQPVVGVGSWKECHGIGKYHAATVYVHGDDMPSFLRPHWDEIWGRVVRSYEDIGLRWIRTDERNANIDFQFVNRGSGWIGLAIVGQRQSCGSQIWCKYVSGWRPSDIVAGWTELIQHELGHNGGLQHSRGGKMNASLMVGGDPTWRGDPSESILRRLYGGVPIPSDDPPAPPGPPTPPGPSEYGILRWYDEDGKERSRWDVTPREIPRLGIRTGEQPSTQ